MTDEEFNRLHEINRIPMLRIQMERLKNELASYDYIGVKIAMGVATKEDYATEIAHTEELRQQVRDLEAEIEEG